MEIKWKKFRVEPDDHIKIESLDPSDTRAFDGNKSDGEALFVELNQKLETLQERLYAAQKHSILLQGMDTCGKDGTIRKVFDGVNPQGVRVTNFKVPTALELSHDYLWRVHQQTPARGEMVIFNRSHYEDVLVVRIHQLVPQEAWQRRYQQIIHFEQLLAEEGTTILKFFLHISQDEQKNRLLERLEQPEKNWKFNPGDLKERALWGEYMQAYEDVLNKTSTEHAPWYVVPADHKWFRDLFIATVLVNTLEKLDSQPPAPFSAEEIRQFRAQL
jgi:PPK2 family polyphosphate:nucleotide phosphotransferase